MKLHTLNYDGDKYLIYLPNTLKFFKATESTVLLANLIHDGKSYQDVLAILPDVEESMYNSISQMIQDGLSPQNDTLIEGWDKYLPRLVIHISNSCNLSCKYCYANGGNYLSDCINIPVELLDKILDVFYAMFDNIGFISLFGGEPTVNAEAIESVAKYLLEKKKDTKLGLITNGTLIDEKLASLISKYAINVTLSIDHEDMQDVLRPYDNGNGTYETIKANMEMLRKVANQPSQLEVVYTQAHVDNQLSVIDVIKQVQSTFGQLPVHLTPVSSEDALYMLKDEDAFLQSIDDVFSSPELEMESNYVYAARLINSLRLKKPQNGICSAGHNTISVSTTGKIYPCFYFTDQPEFSVADVSDSVDTVRDAVNAMRLTYYNANMHNKDECETCFARTVCYGCLGVNYFETGDPRKPRDGHCNLVKKGLEKVLVHLAKTR